MVKRKSTITKSFDDVPHPRIPLNSGNLDFGKNEFDRILKVINGGLRRLTPLVGTARELSDQQRNLCKFGLNIAKLVFQSFNAIQISHGNPPGCSPTEEMIQAGIEILENSDFRNPPRFDSDREIILKIFQIALDAQSRTQGTIPEGPSDG